MKSEFSTIGLCLGKIYDILPKLKWKFGINLKYFLNEGVFMCIHWVCVLGPLLVSIVAQLFLNAENI